MPDCAFLCSSATRSDARERAPGCTLDRVLQDPLGIDRQLRGIARARAQFRRALRSGPVTDHVFEGVGFRVSADSIDELQSAGDADPLAPAALRWAYLLYEEVRLADVDNEIARAWHAERHRFDQPERGEYTLAELRARALANARGIRPAWFEALLARGGKIRELTARRAEQRFEIAQTLKLEGPDAFDRPDAKVLEAAERFLDATKSAYAELGVRDLASLVERGLGHDSPAVWPARCTPRSLADLLDEMPLFRELTLDLAMPAATLGASSFLRGLWALGVGLRAALLRESLPFVLGHEPYGLERQTYGALFALLPFGESFAKKKLGVPRSRQAEQQRALGALLLLGAREAALRALLRAPLLTGTKAATDAYAELGDRALGVELPPEAVGVLFSPPFNAIQRFAAILLAAEHDARFIREHDEDWYRNPRAIEELRENARSAPVTMADPERLSAGGTSLAARLITSLS